jgi:F0F1-type ATP synthase beta subunit
VSNTLEVISWRQYLLLDSAVRIKGMNNLDSEERAILTKALEVRNYCSLKIK